MHIQSCEHPRRIYNKFIREFMYVPCGHCPTCTIKHGQRWVQRLKIESQCHEYTVFFTLTYDNEHVPSLSFDDSIYTCFPNRNTDIVIDSANIKECLDDKPSMNLLSQDEFYVLNIKDAQNFIKRLRYHIYEKFKKTKEGIPSIRYFLVGEYGPTHNRPHYHGILWFDDARLSECFDELFSKAWSERVGSQKNYIPIGRTDWSYVNSSAASYVAQYVNFTSHLPKILASGKIRPFSICSRRPPIGSLLQSTESIREIFHKGLVQTCVPQAGGEAPLVTPLLPSLRNRLFPKCLRYDKISPTFRTYVYRLAERLPEEAWSREKSDFETYVKNYVLKFQGTSFYLEPYFSEITDNYIDFTSAFRAFALSKRILEQCKIFNVTIEYYLSRIDLYYSNLRSYNLSSWYRFSEEYSKTNSYLDLYSADCDFSEKVVIDSLDSKMKKYYGIDSLTYDSIVRHFDYTMNPDYHAMRFQSFKILKDTTKTKKKNDYYSKSI